MPNTMIKLFTIAGGVFFVTLIVFAALADGPDISAQRLLGNWHDHDPGMRMVAEVIASAVASGFYWRTDRGEASVLRPVRCQRASNHGRLRGFRQRQSRVG